MRVLAIIGALSASTAMGITPSITIATGSPRAVNQSQCESKATVTFVWEMQPNAVEGGLNPVASSTYTLSVAVVDTERSCPSDDTGAVLRLSDTELRYSQKVSLTADQIVGTAGADAGTCPSNQTVTRRVCFLFKETTIYQPYTHLGQIDVRYDSQPPNPPALTGVVEGDRRLEAHWATDESDPSGFTLYWRQAAPGAPSECPSPESSAGSADPSQRTIAGSERKAEIRDDVEDGTSYELWMTVGDAAGNVSGASSHCVAVARRVDDFWAMYRSMGGHDTGGVGCGSASGAPSFVILAASAAALLRRRRR